MRLSGKWNRQWFLFFTAVLVICVSLCAYSLWSYRKGDAEYNSLRELAVQTDNIDGGTILEGAGDVAAIGEGDTASVEADAASDKAEDTVAAGNAAVEMEQNAAAAAADRTEEAMETLADVPEPAPLTIDFEALLAENPDTVAWIDFPGQDVSYPIVQSEDNSHYLEYSFEGIKSAYGAIFLDYRNQGLMNDGNTVIYGHNMKNGSMFSFLKKYREQDYYEKYPYFDIYTPGQAYRCEIIACARLKVETWHYRVQLRSSEVRQAYIDLICGEADYEIPFEPALGAPLVLLSTCSGSDHDYRFVILARARKYSSDSIIEAKE